MRFASNNSPVETFKSFLIPTPAEVVFYYFVSVVLLGLFDFTGIWHWLNGSFVASGSNTVPPATYNSTINNFWVSISQSRLSQILFWVFVGIVVYSLVWFVWNIINNLRNDIVAGDYVHPRSYTRVSYWKSVLESKVIFAVSLIASLIYFVLFFKLFSEMANLFLSAMEDFRLVSSTLLIISVTLVGTLLVYFLVVLGRITRNSWQSVYKGL